MCNSVNLCLMCVLIPLIDFGDIKLATKLVNV